MPKLTTAYAGNGAVTAANVQAGLDVFLPNDLGLVIIPEKAGRRPLPAGLRNVVAWLEKEVGTEGTIPVPDVVTALLDRAEYDEDGDTHHDDLALVMAYDPDNDDDVKLARRAFDAGIRVVDLCQAADDILLADAPVIFDAPVTDDTPPWEEPAPAPDPVDVAGQIADAAAAGVAAAEALREPAPDVVVASPGQGVTVALTLSQDAISALASAIAASLGLPVAAPQDEAPEPGPATVHQLHPETPGTQPEGTRAYYYNERNCTYRPARGKARDGEEKVFLTDQGVEEIRKRKLLA
jgi:hypothetical protein